MSEHRISDSFRHQLPLATLQDDFQTFVQKRDADELRQWLLISFANDDFLPFRLDDEPSAARQLQSACAALPTKLRERFKDAAVRAVFEWQPEPSGKDSDSTHEVAYAPFLDLISLAASIRASALVAVLREKLIEHYLTVPNKPPRVIGFMVGAIQGFAPLDIVKDSFRGLYFDDYLRSRIEPYAAQLLIGLCICDPDNYTDYLPDFIEMQQRHPEYYSLPHIVNLLVDILTFERIARHIQRLDRTKRVIFLRWLERYHSPPAYLAPPVGAEAGEDDYVLMRGTTDPQRLTSINIDDETFNQVIANGNGGGQRTNEVGLNDVRHILGLDN